MQLRARAMDLDSATNENRHANLVRGKLHKQNVNVIGRGGKRAFGKDLTNQQLSIANQPSAQSNSHAKCNASAADNDVLSKPKPLQLQVIDNNIKNTEMDTDDDGDTPRAMDQIPAELMPETSSVAESESEKLSLSLAPWDVAHADNDLYVTDYIEEIMQSLRSDESDPEASHEYDVDFMAQQFDVNQRMRCVLVDWLVEVHRKFKLLPATYFLGINLLDRYLSKKQLHRQKLQLCGCTCLWIASKYHEIYAPEMEEFVYISDNAFTVEDLMQMEIDVLKTLSFRLTVPTVLSYAQRYAKIPAYYLKNERETRIIGHLIMYCVEQCVMSYDLCRKRPSLLAAACFVYSCLATKVFTMQQLDNDGIAQSIGYAVDELQSVMVSIDAILRGARSSKYKAIYRKYSNAKMSNVGRLNFERLHTSFLRNDSEEIDE